MGEVFLDRYEAEREVGQGGMAVVYRGTDRVLHRPVAIKVLHTHLSQKAEARARFAREARVIAKLRHPNVVEVYDFAGEESDRAFIVAEFVEGLPLSDFLDEHGPMLPEIAALVTAAVSRALHHAHGQGVIHRDVKPENIMVRRDGVLKLMDFGIAHVVDMEHLTMTGAIIGSPAHMSPEQVDGKALDARTDIFSLGTLLFLMASGLYPFTSDTASGLLRQIVEARVPDIRALKPGFPEDLFRVLRKMMARVPADRQQSAAEVACELETAAASVGLGRDPADLARFFADPAAFTAAAGAKVASARLARARTHLKDRKPALAIRELDGVIANDPDNEDAKRWLARAKSSVRRRAVSRSAIVASGVGGVLIGIAIAAIRLWPVVFPPADVPGTGTPGPASASPGPSPRDPSDGPVASERRGAVRPGSSSFGKSAERNGKTPTPTPGPVKTPEARFPVTIAANPPAARVLVDGRFVGQGYIRDLALAPGQHRVRLEFPECQACRDTETPFTIDPINPLKELRLSIGYKEATLTVSGPAGAQVLVNGVPRGRTSETLRIPMTGPTPVAAQVTVRVEGQPARVLRVTLEAGKAATLVL